MWQDGDRVVGSPDVGHGLTKHRDQPRRTLTIGLVRASLAVVRQVDHKGVDALQVQAISEQATDRHVRPRLVDHDHRRSREWIAGLVSSDVPVQGNQVIPRVACGHGRREADELPAAGKLAIRASHLERRGLPQQGLQTSLCIWRHVFVGCQRVLGDEA